MLAAALVAALSAAPHPFHTTVAEVELDLDTARLEVAMRAEAFVVEELLTLRHARRVDLDHTPDVDALLLEQLERSFVVTSADGRRAPLRWVGKELDGSALWTYFEVELPEGLHGATVSNTWGFTYADDQVNTLHLRQAGFRATLEASLVAPTHRVVFDGDVRLETLLWLTRRATDDTTPPDLAARLDLRCAEIALDVGDDVAAGRALARAWPTVRATVADDRRRVARALASAEALAATRDRGLLAARLSADRSALADRSDAALVARLDLVADELGLDDAR